MNLSTFVDADVLKQRLPHYLSAIGHPPVFHPSGTRLTALCPLHEDRKPSFTARLNGEAWEWFCHPCGVGGTIIELHAARTGRSVKEFKTICEEIAALVHLDPTTAPAPPTRRTPPPTPAKVSRAIDADELERLTSPWRTRLDEDTAWRDTFACVLGLSPDTLRRLTTPSLDALGIAPAGLILIKADGTTCTLQKPRLAYIYDGGYKIRDPFGTGKPRFWRVGELRRPWRSHWLCRAAPLITDIHLVESESTAAALIEAGFHDPFHQGACVVATSGCNGFAPAWLPLFAGRTVHFWPDADPAGLRFFEETAALLHGTAKRLCRHQFHSQPPTP
ncbi:MAG: CHC2 zinc finger domain-containing protein [Prosthecobacter sp.]|nr:CHC2 zinc finger domain-containing protein [Prosthecobacter sp.]